MHASCALQGVKIKLVINPTFEGHKKEGKGREHMPSPSPTALMKFMSVALYAPQALERAAAGKACAPHMEQAFIIKSRARLLVR